MRKYLITLALLIMLGTQTVQAGFFDWVNSIFEPIQNLGATTVFPSQGGTGTSTSPSQGSLLVGKASTYYTILNTSTLGYVLTVTSTAPYVSWTGSLNLPSTDSINGTNRITLTSYERAVYPTHYGELIRLDWAKNDAKPAITFRDTTGASKAWLVAHDYLLYTNAAYTKTFTDANVNTATDRITVTGHGFINADQVKLWNNGGSLPTGIAHTRSYYAKVIDADTLELYREVGLTTLINITAVTGGGTHSIADVTLGNNPHKHISLETTDDSGAIQTRLEFPYDLNTSWIRTASAHFVIGDSAKLYMTGANATNKEILFGVDETDVYRRWGIRSDSTSETGSNAGNDFRIVPFTDAGVAGTTALFIKRSNNNVGINNANPGFTLDVTGNGQVASGGTTSFYTRREATTEFASNIFRTGATDQWSIQLRNDSTNTLHIRDNINGVTALSALQGTVAKMGIGQTVPTAGLHIRAGTATANTAPLKLTSGTNLTTAEAGAMEYNGTNLFFTNSAATRATVQTSKELQSGQCTLDGAATATCTLTIAYTSATSYVCTTSPQTNTNSLKVTRTSATVVTITSEVTLDTGVVNIICHGS